MNRAAAIHPVAALLALAALVLAVSIALWRIEGPATRCERAGGQMLVGPGGETSCVSRRTFLPLEQFDEDVSAIPGR